MSTTDQFLLALQAYQEIQAELHQEEQSPFRSANATRVNPPPDPNECLPGGCLLLGMTDEGLPLQLDLYDPAPGPLLVAGDGGSGKTAFIQSLAYATNLQNPGDIQFGVLTPFPEEWAAIEVLPNCLGVWPAYHPSASTFISQLVNWAQTLSETHQVVMLFFDGFDLMTGSGIQSQHDLRWLLMHGPQRHVWPVITINPARLSHMQAWLDYFHTRIIGQVKNLRNTRSLVEDEQINLAELLPERQFTFSQSGKWQKFWLTPLD